MAPHNQLQISSALFDAIVVTKPLTTDFYQLSLSCLTLQWAQIRSHNSKGNNGSDQYELSHKIWPCFENFILISDGTEFFCLHFLIWTFKMRN